MAYEAIKALIARRQVEAQQTYALVQDYFERDLVPWRIGRSAAERQAAAQYELARAALFELLEVEAFERMVLYEPQIERPVILRQLETGEEIWISRRP